jgi:hypothetical protein
MNVEFCLHTSLCLEHILKHSRQHVIVLWSEVVMAMNVAALSLSLPLFSDGPRSRCYGHTEWNWQGKTEALGKKPVPVPLCPPQIPHGLTRDRTRASEVRGQRLTTWAVARPNVVPWCNVVWCHVIWWISTNIRRNVLFPSLVSSTLSLRQHKMLLPVYQMTWCYVPGYCDNSMNSVYEEFLKWNKNLSSYKEVMFIFGRLRMSYVLVSWF